MAPPSDGGPSEAESQNRRIPPTPVCRDEVGLTSWLGKPLHLPARREQVWVLRLTLEFRMLQIVLLFVTHNCFCYFLASLGEMTKAIARNTLGRRYCMMRRRPMRGAGEGTHGDPTSTAAPGSACAIYA